MQFHPNVEQYTIYRKYPAKLFIADLGGYLAFVLGSVNFGAFVEKLVLKK